MYEVAALEHLLSGKLELLAMLSPFNPQRAVEWLQTYRDKEKAALAADGQDKPVQPQQPKAAGSRPASAAGVAGAGGMADGAATRDSMVPAVPLEPSLSSPGLVALRRHVERLEARSLADSFSLNLHVSVLEVKGLMPREGLRANFTALLHGRQGDNNTNVALLPNAVVTVSIIVPRGPTAMSMDVGRGRGQPSVASQEVCAGFQSVHPRFPANSMHFDDVPLSAMALIQVFDKETRSSQRLLGELMLPLGAVPGTDPIYVWLPVPHLARGRKSQRVSTADMMAEDGMGRMQVLMRFRIKRPQVRQTSMRACRGSKMDGSRQAQAFACTTQ